jgi:hypothetical protein
MKTKNIIKLLLLVPLLSSCDDLFTPANENIRGLDAMYEEPSYAQGILANAYILLPYSSSPNSDVATDDAVTNEFTNSYLKMATGSWAANNDPMSQWANRRNAIQYLNIFLQNVDKVTWSKTENISKMFNDRMKGEAYGLRAIQMYFLLVAHGGWSNGQLLGVPIVTTPENTSSNFNVPRNSFQECIDSINADADRAISLLPLDYNDVSDNAIPAKYKAIGVTNASDYNRVCGDIAKGRIAGRIVEAIKAQTALLAASPAYNKGTKVTWADAADAAAKVLDRINGVSGMDPNGGTWYCNADEIKNLSAGSVPAEIIWRGGISDDNNLETDNFPPSLYGKGRINPTQNLVDAFPMANGYPINNANSGYSASDPYTGRDPRLAQYIVVNGSKQGPNNTEIITGLYGTNNDVLNKENGYSTRTGYYMRKLMRSECNPNPNYKTTAKHYSARIRYTEIFLDYAEAANEAWGPTGRGSHSYSAYDVIKAIRARAGVGKDNGDAYLESIKGDQTKMRELIRNERRLELCFENQRFYDLRRWQVDMSKLNETAEGVKIDKASDGSLTFSKLDVEERDYKDYMYYGPVPYEEILKWSNLQQNDGWK